VSLVHQWHFTGNPGENQMSPTDRDRACTCIQEKFLGRRRHHLANALQARLRTFTRLGTAVRSVGEEALP